VDGLENAGERGAGAPCVFTVTSGPTHHREPRSRPDPEILGTRPKFFGLAKPGFFAGLFDCRWHGRLPRDAAARYDLPSGEVRRCVQGML